MSDVRDPETDQQLPEVNDRPFIQNLVIADIKERMEHGIRKYGTALQAGNGRDMMQDAYEEILDLVVYLRGVREEQTTAVQKIALTDNMVKAGAESFTGFQIPYTMSQLYDAVEQILLAAFNTQPEQEIVNAISTRTTDQLEYQTHAGNLRRALDAAEANAVNKAEALVQLRGVVDQLSEDKAKLIARREEWTLNVDKSNEEKARKASGLVEENARLRAISDDKAQKIRVQTGEISDLKFKLGQARQDAEEKGIAIDGYQAVNANLRAQLMEGAASTSSATRFFIRRDAQGRIGLFHGDEVIVRENEIDKHDRPTTWSRIGKLAGVVDMVAGEAPARLPLPPAAVPEEPAEAPAAPEADQVPSIPADDHMDDLIDDGPVDEIDTHYKSVHEVVLGGRTFSILHKLGCDARPSRSSERATEAFDLRCEFHAIRQATLQRTGKNGMPNGSYVVTQNEVGGPYTWLPKQ